MPKKDNSQSLVKFSKSSWGVIIYCAAMFWFYVGMVNDGSNIVAPAFAAKSGLEYSTVLSMGTVAGLVGFIFFIIFFRVCQGHQMSQCPGYHIIFPFQNASVFLTGAKNSGDVSCNGWFLCDYQ